MLLPYVEQGPLYNSMNFANTGGAANPSVNANVTAFITTINIYLCPSDTDRLTGTINFGGNRLFGHQSYCGNAGNAPESFYDNNRHAAANGVMFGINAGRPVGVRDVTDGTTNTAAFSEKVMGIGGGGNNVVDPGSPTSSVLFLSVNTAAQGNGFQDSTPTDYYTRCKALNPYSSPLATGAIAQGTYWWDGHPETGLYNHIMTPNLWSCNNNNVNDAAASTASSRHSGGVNVGLCDGSVKFVKGSINNQTWWAVGTRNQSEVIDAGSW